MSANTMCQCGCGKFTPLAPETRPKRGWVKGAPMPFYPHHRKNRWPVSDGVSKKCRKCLAVKPVDAFWINRSNADGRQHFCRECGKTETYAYRTTDRGKIRVWAIRQRGRLKVFRLTTEQFDAMLIAQNYLCAICQKPETATLRGKTKTLCIDHCHTTGKIRGLLCAHCNHAIGKLGDDPALIRRAADYIERFR